MKKRPADIAGADCLGLAQPGRRESISLALPYAHTPRWAWCLACLWLLYSVATLAWLDSNNTLNLLACISK